MHADDIRTQRPLAFARLESRQRCFLDELELHSITLPQISESSLKATPYRSFKTSFALLTRQGFLDRGDLCQNLVSPRVTAVLGQTHLDPLEAASMNRYRNPHPVPYSEESRRALCLAFPRTSGDRLAVLVSPTDQMATVLDILEETGLSWTQVGANDPICPPERSLRRLGPSDEITCILLSARHALIEELLATLEYDSGLGWSLLDRLTWQLEERKMRFGIGLSLPSGSRDWLELAFPVTGFWQSLCQLFGHSYHPGHPLLDRGIFAISIQQPEKE